MEKYTNALNTQPIYTSLSGCCLKRAPSPEKQIKFKEFRGITILSRRAEHICMYLLYVPEKSFT